MGNGGKKKKGRDGHVARSHFVPWRDIHICAQYPPVFGGFFWCAFPPLFHSAASCSWTSSAWLIQRRSTINMRPYKTRVGLLLSCGCRWISQYVYMHAGIPVLSLILKNSDYRFTAKMNITHDYTSMQQKSVCTDESASFSLDPLQNCSQIAPFVHPRRNSFPTFAQ